MRFDKDFSSFRKEIVAYALQFKGNPYVFGETSLTKGTDCSGFTQSVFKSKGIKLPRTSREQEKGGKSVAQYLTLHAYKTGIAKEAVKLLG